ncbi:AraC family transcriptional regulator [Variovorax ginsengisoli]|uniref:AraC family transcriptional regulator n=1 Tax=Variovorax ginsengisoli TaxID=363844 RepID=A0ABT8SFJ8_9BURK|nr:AraC family transcriptional regulator [Variovorax ginsengisoli]MDN8618355.1 AraC family transcriptional regulator [Variovorax ginsengisoli]MDO1537525.1 AraC family transcriptional regulator [Variovorax ginsengisoli]
MTATSFTHHTIPIQQVEQILFGARERGADVPSLLRRADISPALFGSPLSRVTQGQYAALILVLRRALRDELWGLCSRPLPLGSFAQCCQLLLAARTLGEAMQVGLRYYRLLLADFVPRLHVDQGIACLRLVPRAAPDPLLGYAERVFCFMAYGLVSWLVARSVPLLGVDYPTPRHGLHSDAVTLFRAPVHEGAICTGWRFDARWLDLPVVQNEQSLREFLRQAPVSLLVKYRDNTSVTERIRRILRRRLAGELPSLEDIGHQLAMTSQTLRRRLRDEGQGFRGIKDDLRRDAAIEYLARPELTLPEIASQLGFSEASTFHRAFKHWTGVAPGEYRQTRLRER